MLTLLSARSIVFQHGAIVAAACNCRQCRYGTIVSAQSSHISAF